MNHGSYIGARWTKLRFGHQPRFLAILPNMSIWCKRGLKGLSKWFWKPQRASKHTLSGSITREFFFKKVQFISLISSSSIRIYQVNNSLIEHEKYMIFNLKTN